MPILAAMGATCNDLRYAIRLLVRQPVFTLLALTTLALGIGANSAIFAVVNAVLLRPLPFQDPERLVLIEDVIKKLSPHGMSVTPTDLLEYQRSSRAFQSVAGFTYVSMDLTGRGSPERLQGLRISAQIFSVLGVSPALGRGFTEAEDHPNSQVAVISYRLWQRRFAGDPGVVGRVVDFDRTPTTILGVLAKEVEFPLPGLPFGGGYDVWVPLGITPKERATLGLYNFEVVARLKPGVTVAQAQDDAERVAQRITQSIPASAREPGVTLDALVTPVAERVTLSSRRLLWLLAAAVGFVLLIACVNVANLLLARAAGRERELAIRSSLGASAIRLLRQLFTESLLLAAGGGTAGLLLAVWLVPALARLIPASVPRAETIDVDWHVVAFTAAVSILAGLLFGILPAFTASRTGESARLKAAAGSGSVRLRDVLIVCEVALSLVLLVGAGLLMRSLLALRDVNPGFDVQHVLTARITPPETAYPDEASVRNLFQRTVDNLEKLPAATAAGAATVPLLTLRNQNLFSVKDPSIPPALAANATVLGDYFQATGIRLLRGRLFDSRDRHDSDPVLVINETMARQYFPGKDGVGEQIKLGPASSPGPWYTIIGIVADVKNNELANAVRPQLYQPYSQIDDRLFSIGFGRSMVLAVRSSSEPAALTSAVRATVARLDPELPVSDLQTVRAQVEESLAPEWFRTGLVASFAGLALFLAALGIYGVVSFAVTQRTQEIGVRMALGASHSGVLRLVVWQGMRPVAAGVGLGVLASLGLTRLMAGFLFGVPPTDWVTFSAAPVVLCLVALAANLAPARRASSVDAMVALRYE
ncbi:MAG TPA: ABC transporter permease [Bryobacteraceae bacterium]|nr:ABC transporter permease [Bryobacteraceae bacterium]